MLHKISIRCKHSSGINSTSTVTAENNANISKMFIRNEKCISKYIVNGQKVFDNRNQIFK